MNAARHARGEACPRCRARAYCDDCALCGACGFAAPDVALDHPPPPLPRLRCAECGEGSAHGRLCAATARAAAN